MPKELYLVVRPEERHAVEQTLRRLLPPVYATFRALGRGRRGGLTYPAKKRRFRFTRRPDRVATFLPKCVFHAVLPAEEVDTIIEAVRATLRALGSSDPCGFGRAFVVPVGQEIPLTSPPAQRRSA